MSQEKIRIMIVDDVLEGREGLARLLSFEPDMEVVGFATTGAEAIEVVEELRPDVILMDINMPDMDGIEATEQITKLVPASVVMISVQSDKDYIRRAMRVGAKDFLPKPPSADELYSTVRHAAAQVQKIDRELFDAKKTQTIQPQKRGKVIVVYSPQGGAGVTTMAVNVANGLMDEHHRTVLVDANLQFGDVAVHLAIRNDRNIVDLAKAADDLDPDLIENVLATHGTGLRVLAGPQKPQDADFVRPKAVEAIINAMAERFGYVVVDTSLHLDDVSLTLVDMADVLIIVGVPTLPSARNVRVVLDLFEQFPEFEMSKVVFVMNKVPTDKRAGALDPEKISQTLKLQIRALVPSAEKQMLDSLNRGVPVLVNARQSPGKEVLMFTQGLKQMLQQGEVMEEVSTQDTKRGLLGLFGN